MDNLLLSGSRDQQVLLFDVRSAKKPVKTYKDHTQEVCGLKRSPDGLYFASGGNDNMMYVYSPKTDLPLMEKQHKDRMREDFADALRGKLREVAGHFVELQVQVGDQPQPG